MEQRAGARLPGEFTHVVSLPRDVVLVGAGHAHVGVLREFGRRPIPGVRLTLITRQLATPYSGMLPAVIAGHTTAAAAHIQTEPLCRFAGARLVHAAAIGLETQSNRISCDTAPAVRYDLVSIDIGSTPGGKMLPGVAANTIPVKPIDAFLSRFEALRARIASQPGPLRIVVVGGGAGGVELLLALHYRFTSDSSIAGRDTSRLSFSIVAPGEGVLPSWPEPMRRRFAAIFRERGISILTSGRVVAVEPTAIVLEGGERHLADVVFWTTAAEPAAWLRDTGLALDARGFIRVAATFQSVSHGDVFAAGDIAAIDGYDLPKSGVYAVRSAAPLAANIRRWIAGAPLVPHRPQRHTLALVSTGDRHAIGTRKGLTVEGDWVWWLKDWIDRRFMAKLAGSQGPIDRGV